MADFIQSLASRNPSVLVVNPNFKAKTFKEYIEIAKAEPGKLIFCNSGAGSSNHLLAARMQQVIGAEMVHALAARTRHGRHHCGQRALDVRFAAGRAAHQGRQAVRARRQRRAQSAFPDVPTMKELAIPT